MSEEQKDEGSASDQMRHARTVFVLAVALIALVGGALLYAQRQQRAEEREEQELVNDYACAIAFDDGRAVNEDCLDVGVLEDACTSEFDSGRVPQECVVFACEALNEGRPVPLPEASLRQFCDQLPG